MITATWIFALLVVLLWVPLCAMDAHLYCVTVRRHGSQGKLWFGSGFYVWWKHR